MTDPKRHEIETRLFPVSVIAFCSCGWHHTETRRQNARARAAKTEAAIRKHRRSVDLGTNPKAETAP